MFLGRNLRLFELNSKEEKVKLSVYQISQFTPKLLIHLAFPLAINVDSEEILLNTTKIIHVILASNEINFSRTIFFSQQCIQNENFLTHLLLGQFWFPFRGRVHVFAGADTESTCAGEQKNVNFQGLLPIFRWQLNITHFIHIETYAHDFSCF
jgi:hypothetical protein